MEPIGCRAGALQQAIGAKAVTALSSKFPGQRIYVPWQSDEARDRFMRNFSPLIGTHNVQQLFEHFGGLRITVPSHTTPARSRGFEAVDMDRVVELTIAGLTAAQIAKLLKCDPRTVHGARSKARRLGRLKPRKRARRKG